MAELAVKLTRGRVGLRARDNRDDGDLICAFNDRQISRCHCNVICHTRHYGNRDRRPIGGLADRYLAEVKQFKFSRISNTEVVRRNQWTGTEESFGAGSIDVAATIRNRINHAHHAIFGEPGAEYWYGGFARHTPRALAAIWSNIESNTPYRRTDDDRKKWPIGAQEVKSFLFLSVSDFTDRTAVSISAAIDLDANSFRSMHRSATRVNWRDNYRFARQVSASIDDRTQSADVRGFDTLALEDVLEWK